MTTAGVRSSIPTESLRITSRFRPPVGPITSGTLSIEPIGRATPAFADKPIRFAVVPRDFVLDVPDGLRGSDEVVSFEIASPVRFRPRWNDERIEGLAGRYRASGDASHVQGTIEIGPVSFDVEIRIPRVELRGRAFDAAGILWSDVLDGDESFDLVVSDGEIGTNPELVLIEAEDRAPTPILTVPTIPKTARRVLTTADVRGGLAPFEGVAGRIALRLARGRVVRTAIRFVNEAALNDWLLGEKNENPSSLDPLPSDITEILVRLRSLARAPSRTALPGFDALPPRLHTLASQIKACTVTFDHGRTPDNILAAVTNLDRLLSWYAKARLVADRGEKEALAAGKLLQQPLPDLSAIPFRRWRDLVTKTIDELRSVSEVAVVVREWADLCRRERWTEARASALGSRPGGAWLTDAAESYAGALNIVASGEGTPIARLGALRLRFDEAARAATSAAVRSTANTLAMLCWVHAKHPDAKSAIRSLRQRVDGQWAKAVGQLERHVGISIGGDSSAESLGIAEISPHVLDARLFVAPNDESDEEMKGEPRISARAR